MGVKMGWIQIKSGHPLTQNGAALAPFCANGAHPSSYRHTPWFIFPMTNELATGLQHSCISIIESATRMLKLPW